MKRVVALMALLIAVLTVTPATADFYVIAGGGRLGTAITTVPYTITSPGLYYLNNNLTSSGTNNNAITVNADDVTIDLMGFCLTGPGKGSGGTNSGIVVQSTRTNVEIRNGSIKAFGLDGIRSQSCFGIRVVGLRVRDVGAFGVRHLSGYDHLVMDSTVRVSDNGNGIEVGDSGLVKGCQVAGEGRGTGAFGIVLGVASAAVGNTVRGVHRGIFALAGVGSSIAGNMVTGCYYGMDVRENCNITSNTVTLSGPSPPLSGWGMGIGSYCSVTNNVTDGLTVSPLGWTEGNVNTP